MGFKVGDFPDVPKAQPMSNREHRRAAEELVAIAGPMRMTRPDVSALMLSEALVHATLSLGTERVQ